MAENNGRGTASLVVGAVLVACGLLFFLAQVLQISLWGLIWPFFIIVPGLVFFLAMMLGGESAGPLAIPGSIVTMLGLLLFYQNLFNHWESWAYAWALVFPTAVGIGLIISGTWAGRPGTVAVGRQWARVGLIIFAVAGVFFELIIGISRHGPARLVWPLVLVGGGAYLLLRHAATRPRPEVPATVARPAGDNPAEPDTGSGGGAPAGDGSAKGDPA